MHLVWGRGLAGGEDMNIDVGGAEPAKKRAKAPQAIGDEGEKEVRTGCALCRVMLTAC